VARVSGAEAQYHDGSVTTSDAKPRLPRLGNAALNRPTSADQVAAYVRQQILAGVLKPGTHVPQDEIATALNVSRIPVREAIIALEREGWVTHLVHRGAFVNRVDEDLIQDHYALFGLLYGYAARKVGAAPDAALLAELAELERALADCDDAAQAESIAIAFHAAIVAGSNTPRLKVLLRAMSSIFPGNLFEEVPGTLDDERRGQAAIVRALRRGDGDRAANEYAKTMESIGSRVTKFFYERGIFAATAAAD
jgi:DNA-binding GntR family transcriptional regulator